MNIGLMHFRVHETDGVSLEMDKWKTVLERNGHKVWYIADKDSKDTYGIRELAMNGERHKKIVKNAYQRFEDYPDEETFIDEVETIANSILDQLNAIIDKAALDMLVINNVSSLGLHLPAGQAVSRLDDKVLDIAFHHHDFYWERERYSHPTLKYVRTLLESVFPPKTMDARHFVINKIAQEELRRRKGLGSVVVPNVFDFNQTAWTIDHFNHDLRDRLGIRKQDIMLLQATRLVKRKAIEFAVDIAAGLQDRLNTMDGKRLYDGVTIDESSQVHLVMAGMNEMEDERYEALLEHIRKKGVRTHFINGLIGEARRAYPEKRYRFWDVYPHSDAVTYPSVLEGWGNQFIEAVFAKKPVVSYEYPVFESDIRPLGFRVISLGNTHSDRDGGLYALDERILENAVDELTDILTDQARYKAVVAHNYAVAERELSYEKLEDILNKHLLDCHKDQ